MFQYGRIRSFPHIRGPISPQKGVRCGKATGFEGGGTLLDLFVDLGGGGQSEEMFELRKHAD